jgi:hypothetical protein
MQTHDAMDQFLDLIEFAASVNIPIFHSINHQNLTPSGQNRYKSIVKSFCEKTLVPSYKLFSDTTLKQECTEIQINMIK